MLLYEDTDDLPPSGVVRNYLSVSNNSCQLAEVIPALTSRYWFSQKGM